MINNTNISDTVGASFRTKIGRWGRRMAVVGLLGGLSASLYATLPRDPDFYYIPFVTAQKSNMPNGKYIVPLEKRLPPEKQQAAAGAATCAMILMIGGFAMELYSAKGQYDRRSNTGDRK